MKYNEEGERERGREGENVIRLDSTITEEPSPYLIMRGAGNQRTSRINPLAHTQMSGRSLHGDKKIRPEMPGYFFDI